MKTPFSDDFWKHCCPEEYTHINEALVHLYTIKQFSLHKIGKKIGVAPKTVRKKLLELGVVLRPRRGCRK